MDQNQIGFSGYTFNSETDQQTISSNLEQYPNLENGLKFNFPSPDSTFLNVPFRFDEPESNANDLGLFFTLSPRGESYVPSSSTPNADVPRWIPEGQGSSSSEEFLSSEPFLKFISQMLMEENMENQPFMFEDALALKEGDASLYDLLGEVSDNPPPVHPPELARGNQFGYIHGSGIDDGGSMSTSTSITSSGSSNLVHIVGTNDDGAESNASKLQSSGHREAQLEANSGPNLQNAGSTYGLPDIGNQAGIGPSVNELVQNIFTDSNSILQFQRGLEEASKFLPSADQLGIGPRSNTFASVRKKEVPICVSIERQSSGYSSGDNRKNYHRRNEAEIEYVRSNKQSAVYVEEKSDLSEMFDKVLLSVEPKGGPMWCNPETRPEQQNALSTGGRRCGGKRQGKEKETVELRSVLILCAQAASVNDCRTANELLKQIREHASAVGDATQRLAHYFANGLEARLSGNLGAGVQNFFTSLTSKRSTAADMLKAYKTLIQACPFKKFSMFFANKTILHASHKALTLHIVDFGVLYGFQWPILIQYLSQREGGPPKLKFTGIELPQRGFRPTERMEDTGRRLKKYCDQFNVPFEYNPIVLQNWEQIRMEDLKIKNGEFLAVNCQARLKNLLDESDQVLCQRDAVLCLIRKMNPNIFVHAIVNGSYSSSFFITRFREALFYFSSVFDMFDCTLPRDDAERFLLESEFHGRDVMNVAACDGLDRVDRPESYKKWQVRMMRAGFKNLPLNQDLIAKFTEKVKEWYHKDFVMDVDNEWMLQGWKGRIMHASTCWVPA